MESQGYDSPEQMLKAFYHKQKNIHSIIKKTNNPHFDFSSLQTLPSALSIEKAPSPQIGRASCRERV